MGSIDLDSEINKYQTSAAQFRHDVAAIYWRRSRAKKAVLLRRFHCLLQHQSVILGVANVYSFLSIN